MTEDNGRGIDVQTDAGETKRIYFPEPEKHNRIGQMHMADSLTYNFEAPDDETLTEMAFDVARLAANPDDAAWITFREPMYGEVMFLFRNGARAVRGLGVGFMDTVSPEVKMRALESQQRAAAARVGRMLPGPHGPN